MNSEGSSTDGRRQARDSLQSTCIYDMNSWPRYSRGRNHQHPQSLSDKGNTVTMTRDYLEPQPPPRPQQQQKNKRIITEEEEEEQQQWPAWLHPFLQTNFFVPCDDHSSDSQKMECNMYCLNCISGALCALCLSNHSDHHVVQIRRSSYHDVIRVSEIQRVVDVSGVQTYIINSARVVFLNERPQIRAGKSISNNCLVCDRSLVDSFRYCSIGCKVKAESNKRRKKGGSSNVVGLRSPRSRRALGSNDPQMKSNVKSNALPGPALASVSARPPSRRRKGIPHRAPFGVFAA